MLPRKARGGIPISTMGTGKICTNPTFGSEKLGFSIVTSYESTPNDTTLDITYG